MSTDIVARGLAASQARSANTLALASALRSQGFFPQPLSRAPAADIPTASLGTAAAVSAINGRAAGNPMVTLTDPRLKWLAGPTTLDGSGSWYARGAWYGATLGRQSQYGSFEFAHTGIDLELCFVGSFASTTGNIRMLVNDRVVSVQSVPNATGSYYYLRFTFPSSATRRIRIEGANGKFKGINVTASGEITATGRSYPLITVMGDSFAEGTGANPMQDGEAVTMVRALGGAPVLAAVGGTGLLNPGTGGKVAWTDATRMTDLTMAGVTDALGYATAPAMGVVMMSLNDNGLAASSWNTYGSTFQAAVTNRCLALIDAWVAANPGRPLVFFGPTWPSNTPSLDIFRLRDGTQEACWGAFGSNVWFIDRLLPGAALRNGSRTSTSATGNTTNASAVITGLSSTSGVSAQSGIVGNGIPVGARVVSVDSATQVTLDVAATATATGATITFLNDHAALMTNQPTDTTHPNAFGHSLDGLWMARELRRLILTEFA